jgi:biopolymer transport protein ExbB
MWMIGVMLSSSGPRALAQEIAQGPAEVPAATSTSASGGSDSGAPAGLAQTNAAVEIVGRSQPTRLDHRESFLKWMVRASGPIGLVIALMSFYLIALVVWMALNYRTSTAIPPDLVRDVRGLLEKAKYQEAYHKLAGDRSFLARVLTAGVQKLPAGLTLAQRALDLANEDVTMEMEHRTTYLATAGTLGPMIGLVGTVYGMIMAFRVIALEASTPQASQLAAGISTALFATLEGIAISIPAIFFYAVFRNRIARLSMEVDLATEPLLEQFAPGVCLSAPNTTVTSAPARPVHPHPFAVSAALAAAASMDSPRSALPPAQR